jgi:hypothetical protein
MSHSVATSRPASELRFVSQFTIRKAAEQKLGDIMTERLVYGG